eukprot:CAMPEP_0172510680 /NCGR_PEP_ID=MMETSP1066-20121228/230571_1 /TAXON_ID=671091 /ORGANISM="Coscinodiscus wailesii, Strain CCMP2513" /LENGTH=58 /DNA_ID=CAMNT_0013289763 /DNA_START=71 /DNA_END=244 /DNA_ORIENTATION=-
MNLNEEHSLFNSPSSLPSFDIGNPIEATSGTDSHLCLSPQTTIDFIPSTPPCIKSYYY